MKFVEVYFIHLSIHLFLQIFIEHLLSVRLTAKTGWYNSKKKKKKIANRVPFHLKFVNLPIFWRLQILALLTEFNS